MVRLYNTFVSIQGESSYSGYPCFFIRLAGCPLQCSYCDSRAACDADGIEISQENLINRVLLTDVKLVEVTGGEPLAQIKCFDLLKIICDLDKVVLLETSGAFSVSGVDPRVRIIMDVKCPDSLMNERIHLDNFELLEGYEHELKFVISSQRDFVWAYDFIHKKGLCNRNLLVSPVIGRVVPSDLAAWILDSGINFRFQVQLHKFIWPQGGDDK